MDVWHFTELPYPHLPPLDQISAMRITLPNSVYDPVVGGALYNRYLDEYMIADDLGFNIMLNEHHSTATAVNPGAPLLAAILARQTKKARFVILGNPIANRNDPIRIAEEMAMVDCISSGRLECGFVRGVPYEVFGANTNPAQTLERLWEGIDLVIKTWTSHDGPFNYEGKFWHRRAVNIWPRPFQEPHPRIWITGSTDKENIKKVAGRGYVFATFLQPYNVVKNLFDLYREHYVDSGMRGGMAFMPLVFTGETESEALTGAEELAWFFKTKAEPQHRNPPGYSTREQQFNSLRGTFSGRTDAIRTQGLEYLRESGILIVGTPDSVAEQIETYYQRVGGFDHLLVMQQAGFLDHAKTVKSMKLFAKHVIPRLKELPPSEANRPNNARGEPRGPLSADDIEAMKGHAAE